MVRVTGLMVGLVADSLVVRQRVIVEQQVLVVRKLRVMHWALVGVFSVLETRSMLVVAAVVTGVVASRPATMSAAAADPTGPARPQRQLVTLEPLQVCATVKVCGREMASSRLVHQIQAHSAFR